MYVVPNHMLEQFAREFMQLYPNAKLLVAGKDDFTKDRRKLLTAKIATGRLGRHRRHPLQLRADRHVRGIPGSGSCASRSPSTTGCCVDHAAGHAGRNRNIIKTDREAEGRPRGAAEGDLLAEDKKDDGLVFDELGVDHVFIDEAHYFKNLETPTKMERVAGIQTGGSERAFDLYMKCPLPGRPAAPRPRPDVRHRHPDQQHDGRAVHDAAFLDPDGLKDRGIEHFDAWAATFGEVVESDGDFSPDGRHLRPRSRFAKFVNLPELQQMFRAFADVQTAEMLDLPTSRARRRQAAGRRLPHVGRAARPPGSSWSSGTSCIRKGRPTRGQRPGHHHRRPQARPRRPDAVPGGGGISRTRRSTRWSKTWSPSGSRRPTPAAPR